MLSCSIEAQTWVEYDKYYNLIERQIVKDAIKKLYSNYTPFSRKDENKYINIILI